jgi:serralysin
MSKPRIRNLCFAIGLAIFLSLCGTKPFATASFHEWQVKEVFTNSSGSVQFVEMFDSFGGETFVNGFTLTANSDGNVKTFTFPNNITGTPGSMLIATTGFGSLPGAVTPDFTFNQGGVSGTFFNPNATNLSFTFSGSGDSMSFTGASLPKDGINSLTDAGAVGFPPGTPNISSGLNSPTNLNGNSGSVNLAPEPTTIFYALCGIVPFAMRRRTSRIVSL